MLIKTFLIYKRNFLNILVGDFMICVSVGLILVFIVFGFGSFLMNEEHHKNKFKVYISGPMTGYEDFNFSAFNEMEAVILNDFDFIDVVNPVDISQRVEQRNSDADYQDYLREDFRALLDCDAVLLLEGWKDSGGCRKEVAVANALAIPCFETYAEFKKFLEEKGWM